MSERPLEDDRSDDRPDDLPPDLPDDRDQPAAEEPAAATGHPAVDEVLRSLDGLDGRPVDEHVAAFEDAHERLRRALSGAGDDPAVD